MTIFARLQCKWEPKPVDTGMIHLPDTVALVIGVGGAGAEVARLASCFGMTVLGTDARRTAPPPGMAELHPADHLDALLPRADFVISTVPHTPATEGFMNGTRFRLMKPTSYFINIGRGRTTRLDDLVTALETGEIKGAALDVFEQEPLPPDNPLWTMPHVLITPHVAGYGPHLDERRLDIVRDNLRAFLNDAPLRNVVDKALWY